MNFSRALAARRSHVSPRLVTYDFLRGHLTFFLSGDMDSNHIAELEALIAAESNRLVFLDLPDVTLVNREAIEFLAGAEAAGAVLINCPEYVRSWIDAEQGDA
jgi:hypothetical protein